MSDPFRQAVVDALNAHMAKPITLEEFKLDILAQKDTIEVLLEKYRGIVKTGATTSEQANAVRKVEVLDAKLDMIKYIIGQADKIEIPKAKMREFL
jgi:hypothetical protein